MNINTTYYKITVPNLASLKVFPPPAFSFLKLHFCPKLKFLFSDYVSLPSVLKVIPTGITHQHAHTHTHI